MFATRAVRDPGWARWGRGDDFTPGAETRVNRDTAAQLLTVYGCVTRIADVMATMPVDHYTRRGGVQELVSQPAPWLDSPNPEFDWPALMTQVVWSLLIDGNAFLVPIRTAAGRVSEVWALNPASVWLQRRAAGRPVEVLVDGAPFRGELLHIPAYLRPGDIRGINPIDNARVAIGLGMSAQEYGAGFFNNSGIPSLVLKFKGNLNETQLKAVKDSWRRSHGGPTKAGGVGLLEGGGEIQQLSIAPEQAQFLESRRFSAAEIAANLFHVPPDMVGVAIEGSSITYQNMETRWTEFVRSACQPWMTRIERAMSRQFLPRPHFLKFVPDVYLRADTKTRYETHKIGIDAGFLLDDEARELEDLPPLTDEQREQAAAGRRPGATVNLQ